ncbi:MAG TPA: histidine phosphatase family protein [Acidimicrobiia bacterium]|nr:histidine phosphatase family protein [Acidimicrobiia bacterium]
MIVLVRHGQTDANRAGRLLGRADPPLNARGREQAAALGTALEAGPAPQVVVTSPLLRTRETAAAIGDATGVPVWTDERLIELDYGDWDERLLTDVPGDVAARWRSDPSFAAPGGESLVDLRTRIVPCAESLMDLARDGLVIAVSHVSPIKAIICWALELDDGYAWRLRLDVASISRLATGLSGPVLVTFNETGHLRATG